MSLILERTTILPSDDKKLAKAMFRQLIHEQAKVVVVVLGTGAEAETTVQRADQVARTGVWRWVCWARKPEHIREDVAELKGAGDLPEKLDTTRVFSTSFGDEVRDRIHTTEPVPGITRLMQSYVRAEK